MRHHKISKMKVLKVLIGGYMIPFTVICLAPSAMILGLLLVPGATEFIYEAILYLASLPQSIDWRQLIGS
tara:strand:+ start:791 stop:1000 length:210 start_codon:yes stop_codon:yes gene_type:complete